MDPITLMMGAISLGTMLFGADKQSKAADEQAKISAQQAKASKQYAAKSTRLIKKAGALDTKSANASMEEEAQRAKQMELDATRQKRDFVRSMIQAQSVSQVNETQQGVQFGDSSAIASRQQIGSEGRQQQRDLAQNLTVGRAIFKANRDQTKFTTQANAIRTKMNILQTQFGTSSNTNAAAISQAGAEGQIGASYMNIGSTLLSNIDKIDKIGTSLLFGSKDPWNTTVHYGG